MYFYLYLYIWCMVYSLLDTQNSKQTDILCTLVHFTLLEEFVVQNLIIYCILVDIRSTQYTQAHVVYNNNFGYSCTRIQRT